jgi:hypothetical protein
VGFPLQSLVQLFHCELVFKITTNSWQVVIYVKCLSDLTGGCKGLDGHQFAGRVENTGREWGPNSRVDGRIRLCVRTPQHSTPGPYLELAIFA